MRRYEALAEILQALLANGCYWGEQNHIYLWAKCLERIVNLSVRNRATVWQKLKLYPALLLLYTGGIISLMAERYDTFPVSDHLYQVLREPLRELLPEDITYEKYFDRFEYLLALIYADLEQKYFHRGGVVGPIGCFGWRYQRLPPTQTIMGKIEAEVAALGQDWPPLKAGLFNSSVDRFLALKRAFDEKLERLPWR